ncbi:MAG TPA: sigma-70 family RNA polymerase sigma factor [Mycobacteriales bacterium]|nr:sigma-70 family RNA polymerase sigma factor [Mycobacteriales bacterium]
MLPDFDAVLARARAGEGAAFRELHEDLAGPVAAYLRHRGAWEVQDLTSEVFLAAFTSLSRFTGGQGEFRSWIFTIAHRRLVDEWRRAGRAPQQVAYVPEDDVRTAGSAEAHALDRIGEQRVRRLLGTLSPDQQEVLLLRILGDLTVEQVADAVGKRPGAVKALQRRGLASLRRAIEAEGVPL